jgi:hypothetical protein
MDLNLEEVAFYLRPIVPDVGAHTCNPSIWEAEAGGSQV